MEGCGTALASGADGDQKLMLNLLSRRYLKGLFVGLSTVHLTTCRELRLDGAVLGPLARCRYGHSFSHSITGSLTW